MTTEGIGFGRRSLIKDIITKNWNINNPEKKIFSYNELLFVIQEMVEEEGKAYFEGKSAKRGYQIFRNFVQHLMYRNLANYDSMILITSDKGCITDDSLIEMPRDLKKYPKGIPVKELIGKKNFYVYSFNIKTKKLEVKLAKCCEYVKTDDIYELELTNGMKIKTTRDHPFLLIDGTYKQLKDICWNEYTFKSGKKKGQTIYTHKGAKKTDRLQTVVRFGDSLINDVMRINHAVKPMLSKNEKYKKEHNFIYEQIYEKINKGYLVHHKNGKHFDNSVENLQLVSFSEHGKIHKNGNLCEKGKWVGHIRPKCLTKNGTKECNIKHSIARKKFINNPKNKKILDNILYKSTKVRCEANKLQNGGIIKSIKYLGKEKVYDIVDVKDNRNFIANGFVVSNSGKSSAAIMIARLWCLMLGIRFNPERHIAYNNADMMSKIDKLNKFEPIIADEAVRFASACIIGDTKIKTKKGDIKIKDLEGKNNFEVYSYNEKTKKEEIQNAEKCIKVKDDIVYEIELEDGKKIETTKEHKFLTITGWKTLEELKKGDDLIGI